jgi:outer membrane receptor protein involved in Fe transport
MRKSSITRFWILSALLVIAAWMPLQAQTGETGALTLNVTDPSGAVIVGATVKVGNASGLTRSDLTDTNGSHTFTLLPPGNYAVSITAPGFSTIEIPSVTINVTETHVLNQQLVVGSQTQQVTVQTDVQSIQTETATLGDVVSNKAINDLPLVTRNFTQIMTLSPGVNANVENAAALGRGFQPLYTNGFNDISNTYQIDGVTVNSYGGGSADGGGYYGQIATPSPDALQEFKVQTAQYDAGFGRNPGAQVNLITRSGTNGLHGSLFEFFRNEDLNANDFFRNEVGLPTGILRQNQYGGTVGGPIIKDKLFYFFSYQGTNQLNGVASNGSSTINLPSQLTDNRSAAALGAAFCPQNNPVTSTLTFAGGTQVACNGSNISPVALNILNFKLANGTYAIPSPQQIFNAGTSQAIGFGAYSIPATYKEKQELFNIDYVINSKNTLALREEYAISPTVSQFPMPGQPPGAPSVILSGTQLESAKLTTLLSPTLVNEARFSIFYLRASVNTEDQVTPSAVGLTPMNSWLNVMPTITIAGLFNFGGGTTDGDRAPQQTYEYYDQLSWTHGKHTIRTGFDYQRVDLNINVTGLGRGYLTFNTFSDFLLGESAAQNGSPAGLSNVQSANGTALPVNGALNKIRANQMGAFVQDDYKITKNLTLNLGLRWEYDGTAYDSDPANGGDNPEFALDQTVPVPPAGGTFVGYTVAHNFNGVVPPGVVRRPTNLLTTGHAPFHDFMPRIGFAWQPIGNSGKFVVRGGFGSFFQDISVDAYLIELNINPPLAAEFGASGPLAGQSTLANPFFPNITRGFFPSSLRTTSSFLDQLAIAPNLVTPVSYDYNLNLQYAFTNSTVLEVGYVGVRAERIINSTVFNTPQMATASNPVNCSYPSGCITANTAANAALRAPVLGLGPNLFIEGGNFGDSDYNSLQATLRQRLFHGLQAQASYTFGRTMTDITGSDFVAGFGGSVTTNNVQDRNQMHALADYNRAQRLVISYFYSLPGFHDDKGFAGRLLSNWNVSGVTVVQSGQPMTLTDSAGAGIYGYIGTTTTAQMCPGFTYGQLVNSGSLQSKLNGYFNLNGVADTVVTAGSASCPYPVIGVVNGQGGATGFGNTGRNILIGPGQFNWEISINKNFTITERVHTQFRTDFFNAFNHPQFSNPATTVNTGSFGQITSTTVAPRIVQFSLRLVF